MFLSTLACQRIKRKKKKKIVTWNAIIRLADISSAGYLDIYFFLFSLNIYTIIITHFNETVILNNELTSVWSNHELRDLRYTTMLSGLNVLKLIKLG